MAEPIDLTRTHVKDFHIGTAPPQLHVAFRAPSNSRPSNSRRHDPQNILSYKGESNDGESRTSSWNIRGLGFAALRPNGSLEWYVIWQISLVPDRDVHAPRMKEAFWRHWGNEDVNHGVRRDLRTDSRPTAWSWPIKEIVAGMDTPNGWSWYVEWTNDWVPDEGVDAPDLKKQFWNEFGDEASARSSLEVSMRNARARQRRQRRM